MKRFMYCGVLVKSRAWTCLQNINGYLSRTYSLCWVFSADHISPRRESQRDRKNLRSRKSKWSDYVLTWTFLYFNLLDLFIFSWFLVAQSLCIPLLDRVPAKSKKDYPYAWNLIASFEGCDWIIRVSLRIVVCEGR